MKFPIHCLCEGPDFGKLAVAYDPVSGVTKEYMTNNPIPEGTKFIVQYGDYTIRFEMYQHFLSDPDLSMVKVLNVVEKSK